jgi:DNA modification methylase
MGKDNPSFLILSNRKQRKLPQKFRNDDVRYSESLVEYFLKRFTLRGAKVLDPFAGFGTTLITAERLGRHGYGVEFDPARADYVKSLLRHPERLIHGDSRKIDNYNWPKFDFCMTSPPYTSKGDPQNPFTSYETRSSGYAAYLRDLTRIYQRISKLMKPKSPIVIEIANIKKKEVTTLAWDVAHALSKTLTFEGEIVVGWEGGYGYGYDHSYCLVFKT